jgi:hypothetical protein
LKAPKISSGNISRSGRVLGKPAMLSAAFALIPDEHEKPPSTDRRAGRNFPCAAQKRTHGLLMPYAAPFLQ